jgi:hypothetical protein
MRRHEVQERHSIRGASNRAGTHGPGTSTSAGACTYISARSRATCARAAARGCGSSSSSACLVDARRPHDAPRRELHSLFYRPHDGAAVKADGQQHARVCRVWREE